MFISHGHDDGGVFKVVDMRYPNLEFDQEYEGEPVSIFFNG
jgi:hypothetical protein